MARASGIQWTASLQNQLRKEVKNYNARVRAFAKKHPQAVVPPIVSFKESKRLLTTKRDYNKFVKDLQSVTAKSLTPSKKSGVSPYERRLRKRASSEVNKRVRLEQARQKKRLSAIQRIKIDSTPGRFPDERVIIARDIGLLEGSPKNIEKLETWLDMNRAKSELWRQNYLKAITNSMNDYMGGYTTDAIDAMERLYQKIASMDLIDFLIGQLTEGEALAIKYIYPNKARGTVDAYTEAIKSIEKLWDITVG